MPEKVQSQVESKNEKRILKESLCAKCKTASPTVSSRQNNYCESCFLGLVDHRFKCHFLKIKVPSNPKVLIAVSGGAASRTLLHLLQAFTKSTSPNKPLLFPEAVVCHVDQSSLLGSSSLVDGVRDMANLYGMAFVSVDMADCAFPDAIHSSYDSDKCELSRIQSGTLTSSELLQQCISECSNSSSQEDIFRILTMRSLVKAAKQNGCNVIVLGDTANLLAVRTIAMTSRGRGINLSTNVALSSTVGKGNRHELSR